MPTLKELMGDKTRGDGRKFAQTNWPENERFEPIFLGISGRWHDITSNGDRWSGDIFPDNVEGWHEWTPPMQTKKVKLYRPIRKYHDGIYQVSDTWESEKIAEREHTSDIVGWQEMEVEVTE